MRRLVYVIAAAGVALVVLGVVLLTVEVSVFRWTTQDHDFAGLTCGTPLDHPDWNRGEPCDGAVSRQMFVAGAALLSGVGACASSVTLFVQSRKAARRAA